MLECGSSSYRLLALLHIIIIRVRKGRIYITIYRLVYTAVVGQTQNKNPE